MTDQQSSWSDVRDSANKLLTYCRSNDWAGYDPYDALNSPLFKALPVLDRQIPRLVLTQLLKRSPFSVRKILGVPKTQNPKAMALFLTALLRAPELANEETISSIKSRLIALRSPSSPYWCWGYSFPWQTRTLLVPRAVPNLVCSVFVGNALLDLYDRRRDEDCRAMAATTAEYILNELYWTKGSVAGLGYPLPSMRHQIHNANLLGAAFLTRVYTLSGNEKCLEAAMKLARYSASCQRSDGSWAYGEGSTQQWVDNFHTGYNLSALQQIDRLLETNEFEERIRQGFGFYRTHFFLEDGTARYFHNKTYPVDIHCVAQSIITLLEFRHLHPDNVELALRVFQWAKSHMWDERGFFFYRVLRGCTIRTSYMRWSQAWMLLALSTLLGERVEDNLRADFRSGFARVATGMK
ncbi:MAG: hypothetical protein LAO55_16400 [Acidobacteriia bacterium]|nr:hypothetical protein [Terriglobia bacterium]